MTGARKKITILSILLGAALIGAAVGVYLNLQLNREKELERARVTLRVLTYKGLLSANLLKEFEEHAQIRVQTEEVANPEELWDRLETSALNPSQAFDLVSLFSYQVPLAAQLGRIRAIDEEKLPNIGLVSPDFRYLPGEPAFKGVLPVLWGVVGVMHREPTPPSFPKSWRELFSENRFKGKLALPSSTFLVWELGELLGTVPDLKKTVAKITSHAVVVSDFLTPASALTNESNPSVLVVSHGEAAFPPLQSPEWKFTIPGVGGFFWSLVFALHPYSRKVNEAHELLDFLLEFRSALSLSENFRQASTNRRVEESDLDARLGPSYLRQIPLHSLEIPKDFNRAREIRELLNQLNQ